MAKIDRREFNKLLSELEGMPNDIVKKAYEFFVDETPYRKGNAKRKTVKSGKTIQANYPYAGRLDNGYSRQAPKGMSQPTLEYIEQLVNEKTRRL